MERVPLPNGSPIPARPSRVNRAQFRGLGTVANWVIPVLIVLIVVIGGMVVCVNVWHNAREREQSQVADRVRDAEEYLARLTVAKYSGVKSIEFEPYWYHRWAGTTYRMRVNGVETSWMVDGEPGSIENPVESGTINDDVAFDEGWFAGDRGSGVRKRDAKLDADSVTLNDVEVKYCLQKDE